MFIMFSFCVYADALWIPVPLILQTDSCKHLWYFYLKYLDDDWPYDSIFATMYTPGTKTTSMP